MINTPIDNKPTYIVQAVKPTPLGPVESYVHFCVNSSPAPFYCELPEIKRTNLEAFATTANITASDTSTSFSPSPSPEPYEEI